MTITIIILVILAVVLFFLFFRLLKSVIKAILTALLVVLIIIGALGVIVYFDTTTLIDSLSGEKTVLLELDNQIVAGVDIGSGDLKKIIRSGLYDSISSERIADINSEYKKEMYKDIYDEGILIVFNYSNVQSQESVEINKFVKLTPSELITFFNTKTIEEAEGLIKQISDVDMKIVDENTFQDMKNDLFVKLMFDKYKNQENDDFIEEVKTEQVIIYPDFISITIIKYLPFEI